MKEAYNIGLDIGTSSVGYAMTDEKGRLLRFHKRPTYGSVLFEEAQTAKERRQKRSARRRLARRHKRIKLLQALVAPDVCAADPAFFLRMTRSYGQRIASTRSFMRSCPKHCLWMEQYPSRRCRRFIIFAMSW